MYHPAIQNAPYEGKRRSCCELGSWEVAKRMEVDIIDDGQYEASSDDCNRLRLLNKLGKAKNSIALTTANTQPTAVVNVIKRATRL